MRRKLIVLGSSGLAREMAMVAEQINARTHAWEIAGFIGEPGCRAGASIGSSSILGDDDWLLAQEFDADLVVGVGYPQVRAKILSRYLDEPRFRFPNLVHPSSVLDFRRVELGRGNVITAGCALTCDIQIGSFNLFNLNVTVGHDAQIGDFNVLNPSVNVSGNVRIGDRILVGTGAQILEGIEVQNNATIGAGAVVVRPVEAGFTVVGIPAKPLGSQAR